MILQPSKTLMSAYLLACLVFFSAPTEDIITPQLHGLSWWHGQGYFFLEKMKFYRPVAIEGFFLYFASR